MLEFESDEPADRCWLINTTVHVYARVLTHVNIIQKPGAAAVSETYTVVVTAIAQDDIAAAELVEVAKVSLVITLVRKHIGYSVKVAKDPSK